MGIAKQWGANSMATDQELPPISTSGKGAAKAFAKGLHLLEEGETPIAFLYTMGGSSLLATRTRILVWPYDKPAKATEFLMSSSPRLEKRGFLDTAYLVSDTGELKLNLPEKELNSLTGLLNQDHSGSDGEPSDDAGGLSTWVADSGSVAAHVKGILHDSEKLVVLAGRVSDTSLFVTNQRIGIVRKFLVFGEETPVVFAQHRLTSVKAVSFAKSIKNIKVTLETSNGTSYDYAKVRPTELEVVERLTREAIDAAAGSADSSDIVEFAALMEDLVATVHGYSWMKRMGDNSREVAAKGEGSTDDLFVFKKAVLQAHNLHLIDADVSAEVTSNGGVQVTHRPTMTRMAAGAILPGTALIPGLAFQKKKSIDSRSTYFVCAHPDWMLDVNVDPDSSGEALKAAKYINKQAEVLAATRPKSPDAPAPAASSPANQIREMKALLDEGVITQEDFDKFKAGLLG